MADFDRDLESALRTVAAEGRTGPARPTGGQVRRIADRRQARQRALTAAAAVVVLLVGGSFALNHTTSSSPQVPGHSGEPTPESSSSPSTSPTVDKPRSVTLLSSEQLPAPTSGAWLKQTSLEGSFVSSCLSSPGFPTGLASYQQGYATKATPKPLDEAALIEVMDLGSADAAKQALTDASNAIQRCWFSSSSAKVTAGDEGVELSGTFKPDPSAKPISAQSLLLVRVGPELGVVALGVDGKGDIEPPSPFLEVLGRTSGKALADVLATDKGPSAPAPSVSSPATPAAPSVMPSDAVHLLAPEALPARSGGPWQTTSPLTSAPVNHCFAGFDPTGHVDYTKWYTARETPLVVGEAAFNEVIATGSAAAAHDVFVNLQDQVDNCWIDVQENWAMPVGDEAVLLYGGYIHADTRSIQAVVLVRVGSNVAVLTLAGDGNGDLPEYPTLHDKVPQQLATLLSTYWTP